MPVPEPRPQRDGGRMPAQAFVHEITTPRVVFRTGAADDVAAESSRLGGQRVLLIGGGHESDLADRVAEGLGGRLAGRISDVAQHVPVAAARAATETARGLGADQLLSIGGGSATGLAKAVALELSLPILAVPTTYAGSEMSPMWGLTDARGKHTGRDARVLPRTVIYDPALTTSLPARLSATSGMNALAHAVEALYAPGVSPLVVIAASDAARAIGGSLVRCVAEPGDLRARAAVLYAAFLSGLCLGNAVMGIHHKLCHVLGGRYDLPHADVHAAVLPYSAEFNRDAAPEAMRRLGSALCTGPQDAPAALWRLGRDAGAPTNLRDVGFVPAEIGSVAKLVADAQFANPARVTTRGVARLLARACSGSPPGEG
jgi:maleylacetate reductase